MEVLFRLTLFLAGSLIAITFIDTAGAIASRRFRFNYAYCGILSFFVYAGIGFAVSKEINLNIALFINLINAFYDATIGWHLSMKLKANTGAADEVIKKITTSQNLAVMLVFSIIATFIGYAFS